MSGQGSAGGPSNTDAALALLCDFILREAGASGRLEEALRGLLEHPSTPHDLSGLTEIREALDLIREEIVRGVDLPRPRLEALEEILLLGSRRKLPSADEEPPPPTAGPLLAPREVARRVLAILDEPS